MQQNTCLIMIDIGLQFRRAQDLNMLSELVETEAHITATFVDATRSYIIDAVVKHLNIKYGNHVYAAINPVNPKIVEVWQREMSI